MILDGRRLKCNDDRDLGVATVWAAGAVAVLMTVMVFGVSVGIAVTARHRAEAAADLAALAAAAHAMDGKTAACGYGYRVAEAMKGRLMSCWVDDEEAFVEIEIPATVPLLLGGSAHGRARAGPVRR